MRGNKDPDAASSPVRRSAHGQMVASPDGRPSGQLVTGQKRAAPLGVAARVCCCPARPAVAVVLPPTASRQDPGGLLPCGYLFRASQASLQTAGEAACDKTGMPVTTRARTADAPGLNVGGLPAAAYIHRG